MILIIETIQLRKVFQIRVKLQKLLLTDTALDESFLSKANGLLTELESLNINFFILMVYKLIITIIFSMIIYIFLLN